MIVDKIREHWMRLGRMKEGHMIEGWMRVVHRLNELKDGRMHIRTQVLPSRCNFEYLCLTLTWVCQQTLFCKQTCPAISKSAFVHKKSIGGNTCVTYSMREDQIRDG